MAVVDSTVFTMQRLLIDKGSRLHIVNQKEIFIVSIKRKYCAMQRLMSDLENRGLSVSFRTLEIGSLGCYESGSTRIGLVSMYFM